MGHIGPIQQRFEVLPVAAPTSADRSGDPSADRPADLPRTGHETDIELHDSRGLADHRRADSPAHS